MSDQPRVEQWMQDAAREIANKSAFWPEATVLAIIAKHFAARAKSPRRFAKAKKLVHRTHAQRRGRERREDERG